MIAAAILYAIGYGNRKALLMVVATALLVAALAFLLPGQKTLRELQATPTLTTPIPGQQG